MPRFKRGDTSGHQSESPERLFDDLPHTPDGAASLWAHQADMLRSYHEHHVGTADIALELPTGAGKTLPALLIAEWRRSALGGRAAYACPTVQLANQVHDEARREGLKTVALHGSHRSWEPAEAARYESGNSIAVTTYSTIFNSNPALSPPATLVFDDAHNAEQFVASAWSMEIRRLDEPEVYQQLLDAIGGELSGLHMQRLQSPSPDPTTRADVRLLPPASLRRRATRVDQILGATAGDLKFRYSMIRHALDRCLLLFGWDGFLLRPYIPPTNEHAHFSEPQQRIYVSATLGDGGELERAFGRAPIERLPVPAGWDQRSSGRRFFVFPDLIRGVDGRSITKSAVRRSNKALILAPSDRQLDQSKLTLVADGLEVFGKGDIESSLDDFRRAPSGVLALANRYDGIDLADDTCRLTILDGLPGGQHLLERFLVRSLRAGRVLEERLRTRVIQGAGRCTRGLKDHSVVIILGDDLTRFLQRNEVRQALRPETQAEIAFGIANSDVSEAELAAAIQSCLDQDEDWHEEAEPFIAELKHDAERRLPPGTETLAETAGDEVRAWNLAWRGELNGASRIAAEVAQKVTDPELAPYRTLWLYLAGAWLHAHAEDSGDTTLRSAADEYLRKAHASARGTTWLREMAPPVDASPSTTGLDEVAVAAVAGHKHRRAPAARWSKICQDMLDGLNGPDSGPFEQALTTLGNLLGAEAFKPPGQGRADSAWIFGEYWWATLEAKNEAKESGLISMDNIRQTNTHLRSVAADRAEEIPEGSASVVVSPKQLADQDAVDIAGPHVFMCAPSDVVRLAFDVIEAWNEIRTDAHNVEGDDALVIIRRSLSDHRALPTAVRERLFDTPVRG